MNIIFLLQVVWMFLQRFINSEFGAESEYE